MDEKHLRLALYGASLVLLQALIVGLLVDSRARAREERQHEADQASLNMELDQIQSDVEQLQQRVDKLDQRLTRIEELVEELVEERDPPAL
ncbi:MAG: hypothetical protein EB072_08455 [Betaproteobacteria bacterium]|jgi:Tfp pilus assembly protein PilN|nr:hypothetical protein [Betaproteobacteria bacterium]